MDMFPFHWVAFVSTATNLSVHTNWQDFSESCNSVSVPVCSSTWVFVAKFWYTQHHVPSHTDHWLQAPSRTPANFERSLNLASDRYILLTKASVRALNLPSNGLFQLEAQILLQK